MSQIPSELRYSESHEWARKEDDGTVTVGITHHAQELLGDLVFVELPEVEDEIHAGDEAGVVESVKAASDLFAPVTGEVIEVNEALVDNPALINEDPYGGGWIFKIRPVDEDEVDDLMDADEYQDHIESEAH